ncbi:MAG: sugar phosphate isomerase/epimerase [Acidobacteriota bacterium]|nr:sugar phosphate isomerase/epimerase [Acidobacteriota bacterium]
MTRRELLATVGAAGIAAAGPVEKSRFTKSICSIIFPKELPRPEAFAQAKSAGFDAMEVSIGYDFPLTITRDEARRFGDAAHQAGIQIATIWVSEPLSTNPLNGDDPASRARGVDAIRTAIRIAKDMNCGALLLYPGRLGNGATFKYGYEVTWQRFTAELRKLLPDAEREKVLLNPENVWNKFLVSPLEMRSFVDQFHSPWLQTHFDTGNVMQYGYPEDWIQTLGSRIKRVHFKDYKLSARAEQGHFVDLLQGDVNWKAVVSALVRAGYQGFISPEVGYDKDRPNQLKEVSGQLDTILALA